MTSHPAFPIELQVLGPVAVRRPGDSATPALLTQPRHLAVLSYLVLARPRGLHARDTVVALLWPEANQVGGRHALRNALHAIRQALGQDVIITAGDGLVGVDAQRISCDALDSESDLSAGRLGAALTRYQGELLAGFHVAEAPEFERWLDAERRRLHDAMQVAVRDHVAALRAGGDIRAALDVARRGRELDPGDEAALRQLMQLSWETGDRGAALREYQTFARWLHDEYRATPSAESQKLALTIRGSERIEPLPSQPPVVSPAPSDSISRSPRSPRGRVRRTVRWPVVVTGALLTVVAVLALSSRARSANSPGLGQLPARYATDPVLLQRYLQAEALRRAEKDDSALAAFKELTEEAPLFAPGWAGYALIINISGFGLPSRRALARSRAAAERAMALDSTLPGPYTALAAYELSGRWDYQKARQWLDRGLQLNPDDAELTFELSSWYLFQGYLDEGLRWVHRARQLDPLLVWWAREETRVLYYLRRCDEAAQAYKAIALEYKQNPGDDYLYVYRALKCLGRMDEAAAALRQALVAWGDSGLARLLDPPLTAERRDTGLRAIWRARLERFRSQRQQSFASAMTPVMQYAELQIADSTLMWLDSAFVERSFGLRASLVDPLFDFLRDDPRFQEFIVRVRSAPPDLPTCPTCPL